jgi:hypothetical protein
MKILTKKKLITGIMSLALIPGLALAALNPVLDDVNLFQIQNQSNSATWGTTATASPGQTLDFMVHIHNNVLETFANNVRVQVVLPQGQVTSYTSRATVSADNAPSVSGTVSYTFSEPAVLQYVPGSTRLYNHNNQLETILPDGIASIGINIGDFQGCWQYEKWVMFKARIVASETPTTPETPVTPETPETTVPTSLPEAGPIDASAGILGIIGLGGAGYTYRKSRLKLKNSFKKF